MGITKHAELKDYIRNVCNIGYAISTLVGVAAAVAAGVLVKGTQLHTLLCVLTCIGVAAAVTAVGCVYVWLISLPMRKSSGQIHLAVHILMTLAGGVYWRALWVGHTTDLLNRAPLAQRQSAGADAVYYFFFPVYEPIWIYHQTKRHCDTARYFGKAVTDRSKSYVVITLIGLIFRGLPIISSTMLQHQLNQIALEIPCSE